MAENIVSRSKELTAEILRSELSYDPETGEFRRLKLRGGQHIGSIAGYVHKAIGYMMIDVCGKTYAAHRLAWLYVYGEWPKHTVDHINRCKSDNRISNLRDIEHCQNARNTNKRKSNTSGTTGVYWHKTTQLWTALAFNHGKQISLGYFKSKSDAVLARKKWEQLNPIQ